MPAILNKQPTPKQKEPKMPLLRSLHFVPGISPKMIEKAFTLHPDALVLDLEDSVPLAEKERARELVSAATEPLAKAGQEVFVRINSLSTGLAEDDLRAVISERIVGISLPKPETPEQVQYIAKVIDLLEAERGLVPGRIRLIPWIETAGAVTRVFQIASSTPRIIAVAFGAEDFTLDMGMQRSAEGTELIYPRSQVAIAARVAGVFALDTPYTDFRDEPGLIEEARLNRRLGFHGKFTIHPLQIEPVNRVFTPTADEIEQAARIVKAFEEAQKQGIAATSLDGKMIDTPVFERARRLLSSLRPAGGK